MLLLRVWGDNPLMVRILFLFVVFMMMSSLSYARSVDGIRDAPPSIKDLIDIPKENKVVEKDAEVVPLEIRLDAIKEAALSYGARGGLAFRTWHIRNEMEGRAQYLDKVFDFRQLLIPAPSGLLIEPPVISEAMDAMIIDNGGLNAAVADRVLNINQNVRIVSASRTWRSYLERQWGDIDPPPDVLRPETAEERKVWARWIKEGWVLGIEQADDIFRADLNKLTADYEGMVRYRVLLTQGMVTQPYALQQDRGVTGGGNEMRIGDRGLTITDVPQLQKGYQEWQSVNR